MNEPSDRPSEEELRAAYEQELKRIRVEQILLENIVTLINLGMRRTGLAPGSEDERDPEQVKLAIEGVRAHMQLVEAIAPSQAAQIRQALSQLQLAYVRIGGSAAAEAAGEGAASAPPAGAGAGPAAGPPPPPPPPPPKPGEPGPAQRSGRLWVPGQ